MYWSFKLRQCPAGYPYFQPALLICYDICPDGYYGDNTTWMCKPCHYSCLTCSAYSTCLTCNSLAFRVLTTTSCPPISGYYDNNTSIAVPCNTTTIYCTSCQNVSAVFTCLNCSSGYYVSAPTQCSVCISPCLTCTSATTCITCVTGYAFDSATSTCIFNPCTDSFCLACPGNPNVCTSCASGYGPNTNGICVTICGNNMKNGT